MFAVGRSTQVLWEVRLKGLTLRPVRWLLQVIQEWKLKWEKMDIRNVKEINRIWSKIKCKGWLDSNMIYKFMTWVTDTWRSQVEKEEIYEKEHVWGNDETILGYSQTQMSMDTSK